MYMDEIKLFAKKEKELENNAGSENIQDIGMEFRIKISHANNEKQEMKCDGRNGTTESRKSRMLGEKETYKCLGILEAVTTKQVEMKEKIIKD